MQHSDADMQICKSLQVDHSRLRKNQVPEEKVCMVSSRNNKETVRLERSKQEGDGCVYMIR